MEQRKNYPLTDTLTLITAAYPRHAAKHIERGLDCTPRQALRIVSTGKVPNRFAGALFQLVVDAISRNFTELERLQADLKGVRHEGMVARSADRRAAALGPLPVHDPRLADGTEDAAVAPAQTGRGRP